MADSGADFRRMIVQWRARYRWRKRFNEPLIIPGGAERIRRRPPVKLHCVRGAWARRVRIGDSAPKRA